MQQLKTEIKKHAIQLPSLFLKRKRNTIYRKTINGKSKLKYSISMSLDMLTKPEGLHFRFSHKISVIL